jgi:cell division protein FtsQ
MTPRHAGNAIVKLLAWTLAAAVIALPLVGALNGWFAAERWPFRQLRIDAAFERVNAEQVRAAVSQRLEPGFFATDLGAVRAAVEQVPWVARAEVRRRWPDQLEVRLFERRAAAAWRDGRLVGDDGALFEVPGDTVPGGLPVLDGPAERAPEMLAFLRRIDAQMRGSGLAPAQLGLSARGSWRLSTWDGAEIVLGREAPAERLQRFLDALRQIDAQAGLVLVRADLRYANGFAVEWRQSAPLPPPAPESPDEPAPQA